MCPPFRSVAFASMTFLLATFPPHASRDNFGSLPRDQSRPVASREEIIAEWRKRTNTFKSFEFTWIEHQVHPRGWIPNPRFAEREWLDIPGVLIDRMYDVTKTLAVDGDRMRYAFELARKPEADGLTITDPHGSNTGYGEGKHYTHVSVFDGRATTTTLTRLDDNMPPAVLRADGNIEAQNLDTRPIMMALRPLDPVMGHRLIERAVPNFGRRVFKARSTMILEERRDPSGWKTSLWIEPERESLVNRCHVEFEQWMMVEMDIDYVHDLRWGWIPSGWEVSGRLADGSFRPISQAKVISYRINLPVAIDPR